MHAADYLWFRMFQPICGSFTVAGSLVTRPGSTPRPATPGASSLPAKSICMPMHTPISGFVAGVAGGLIGFAARLASPEAFTLDLSADYIAMIIVGGMGSLPGALIGAAVWLLLPSIIAGIATEIGPVGFNVGNKEAVEDVGAGIA